MPEITTEDFMFASEFFLVNSLPPDFESWADNQLDDYLTNNASEMVETYSPEFIWENIETLARGAVRYAGSRVDTNFPDLKLDYSTDMVCDLCGSNEWHVNLFYKNSNSGGGWYYGEDGDYGTEDVWCHTCESYRNLVSPIDKKSFAEFFSLLMELEPENLWMDGEASKAEVKRREKNILLRWSGLERTVSRSVSQDEIWKMYKEKESK